MYNVICLANRRSQCLKKCVCVCVCVRVCVVLHTVARKMSVLLSVIWHQDRWQVPGSIVQLVKRDQRHVMWCLCYGAFPLLWPIQPISGYFQGSVRICVCVCVCERAFSHPRLSGKTDLSWISARERVTYRHGLAQTLQVSAANSKVSYRWITHNSRSEFLRTEEIWRLFSSVQRGDVGLISSQRVLPKWRSDFRWIVYLLHWFWCVDAHT